MKSFILLTAALAAAEPSSACPQPRYETAMREAAAQVRAMTPAEAEGALKALRAARGADGLQGRLGYASLLAVRAQGHGIESGVYCDEAPTASDPIGDRWVGVTTSEGRRFRLDLFVQNGRPDPADIVEIGSWDGDPNSDLTQAVFGGQTAFNELWYKFKGKLMSLAGHPYRYGGTDCAWLPHAALNSLPGMCSRARSYFDHDSACFTRCDAGPYLPGDVVLLGRSEPDHWVVLSEVNDPRRANSPANKIIDQSSDCGGHCGERPMRPNLVARSVYACARPRALAAAFKADASARAAMEASYRNRPVAAGFGGTLATAEGAARSLSPESFSPQTSTLEAVPASYSER